MEQHNDIKPTDVPYIVFEAEMERQERHIKRLWIALLIAVIACVAITVCYIWYLNQYDFASYQQDGEGVNIVGDSNGVDYNGPTSQSPNQEETLNGEGQSLPKATP